MSETEKKTRAPRKKAEPTLVERVQAAESPETADKAWDELTQEQKQERGDLARDLDKPILAASGLVAHNEVARNSRSVHAVQDALIERGYWDVAADESGYWGAWTQSAALDATGEEDPVKAAEALGFVVLP